MNMKWWGLFLLSGLSWTWTMAVGEEDEEFQSSSSAKVEIEAKDLKALSEARSRHSEEALLQAASKILGVDHKNPVALNALALFYFEQGKLGLSQIILNRALESHPDLPALHNNMGIVYLSQDKQKQALASFRKAMTLKSDYRVGAVNFASLCLEYRDYQRALEPLKSGYSSLRSELKSGSKSAVEVANNYAIALSGIGRFNEAKDVYQEIIKGQSKNPVVLLNYAILLVEKIKNYKEGSQLLNKIKFTFDDVQTIKKVEELEARINSGNK